MKRTAFLKVVYSVGFILLLFGAFHCAKRGFVKAVMPTIEDAEYVGSETCYDCHYELYEGFKTSIHGRLAPFEAKGVVKGCEACHGPGSIHAEGGDPTMILSYGEMSYAELNYAEESELCLQCHTLFHWRSSEHPLNGMACTDCHKIHGQSDKNLLSKNEPKLCYECHQDIRMKTVLPSHHPIWESERTGRKRMNCSDCHSVHGSTVRSLKTDENVNELCFRCHAKYQGPFVFEHAPVVEDCTICHEPHGAVANNLLHQNEPFICLQCHEFHFHAGKEGGVGALAGGTGVFTDPNQWGALPVDHGDFGAQGYKMAYTTKCTQCHSQVHGSDVPSQSVDGQGRGLTR